MFASLNYQSSLAQFPLQEDLDPKGTPQFGLVAEEAAKIDPDLVVTNQECKPSSVRYEVVTAIVAQRVPRRAPQSSETKRKDTRPDGKVEQLEQP